MFKSLDRYREYAPLILRVVIGLLFLLHGLAKFGVIGGGNIAGVGGFFGSLGIPAPALMAPFVALVETLGGLALILGVGTRLASALLAIIMVVAILLVKLPNSPAGPLMTPDGGGYELELVLLAGVLALLLLGPGPRALDRNLPPAARGL